MAREHHLEHLASICRQSPTTALWVLAYLTENLTSDDLERAVAAAEEAYEVWAPTDVARRLFAERYGLPSPR